MVIEGRIEGRVGPPLKSVTFGGALTPNPLFRGPEAFYFEVPRHSILSTVPMGTFLSAPGHPNGLLEATFGVSGGHVVG